MYKVNLLPPELQRDFSIDTRKLVNWSVFILIIASLSGAYALFLHSLHEVKIAVAGAGQYLESLRGDVALVEEVRKQRIKNEQTAKSLRGIQERRILWSNVLEEIELSLPSDMWLARLELARRDSQESPELAGGGGFTAKEAPNLLIFEGYSRSFSSVGIFANNLCRMPYFSRVILNDLKEDQKNTAARFKITVLIGGGGR
ncbi:MAG: PilN domain-containing protein [Firmicutes bacterium]|nr:PilN domain-containing protein [Bacillota bacterium]